MSGVLIYTPFEAKRNEFAVKKFTENLDVKLKYDDFKGEADFVINRTDDENIGKFFEEKGIRVFNSAAFSALANDKKKAYEFMDKNGIKTLPINFKSLPLVAKPRRGKGGRDVRLIEEGEIPTDESLILQKPCDTPGLDLRVYVIGGEIITSFLRDGGDNFLSNFCLGGSASEYTLSEKEKSEVEKIISLTNGDYYGIDFLFNEGEIVFNEFEDSVGARMVYEKGNIDIIKLYCNYIKSVI